MSGQYLTNKNESAIGPEKKLRTEQGIVARITKRKKKVGSNTCHDKPIHLSRKSSLKILFAEFYEKKLLNDRSI